MNRAHNRVLYCPVHEYERRRCGVECESLRWKFSQAVHALNVYWHDRSRRRPHLDLAEYRCRYNRVQGVLFGAEAAG